MVKIIYLLLSLGLGIGTSFWFTKFGALYQSLIAIGFTLAYALFLIALFIFIFFLDTLFENKNKKREYQSKYYRWLLKHYSYFLFSLFGIKRHYSGIEKLDKNKQYLLVCNHRSNMDSLIIDTYLKEFPLTFLAKKSLFDIPFVGKMIHGCAYIKMNRENIHEQVYAIKDAINFIQREDSPLSIGLFPEGTRGHLKSGLTNDFKHGCFKIAINSQKPIAISAIRGTHEINQNLLFKRHHVYYDIIKVIEYSEYKDMNTKELAEYSKNIIDNYLKEKLK